MYGDGRGLGGLTLAPFVRIRTYFRMHFVKRRRTFQDMCVLDVACLRILWEEILVVLFTRTKT